MRSRCDRVRAILGTLAAAAAMSAAAAAPAAAVGLEGAERVGDAGWEVIAGDGERLVAYVTPDRRLRVIDDAAGRASFDVALPDGCARHRRAIAVAGGNVVVRCWSTEPGGRPNSPASVKRLDVVTRVWHDVPGTEQWHDAVVKWPETLTATAVGRRWVAYESYAAAPLWRDLVTGAVQGDDGAATDAPDLDGEQLFRPMCRGIERPVPHDPLDARPFMPTAYQAPFALSLHDGFQLTLQRCGERRQTVIGTSLELGQLGSGIVTWDEGGMSDTDLNAYVAACRLRLGWSSGADAAGWITHVRGAVYVLLGDTATMTAHVERIPLPRGCPQAPRPARVTGGSRGLSVGATSWGEPDAAAGQRTRLSPQGTPVPHAGRVPGALTVTTAAPVQEVQWRVGDRADWRAATRAGRDGRRWRIALPRRAGPRTVTFAVRDRRGASARYVLRVERTARG